MLGSDVRLAEYLVLMFAYLLFSDDNIAPSDGFYVDLDVDE